MAMEGSRHRNRVHRLRHSAARSRWRLAAFGVSRFPGRSAGRNRMARWPLVGGAPDGRAVAGRDHVSVLRARFARTARFDTAPPGVYE